MVLVMTVMISTAMANENNEFFNVEVTGSRTFNIKIRNVTGEGTLAIIDSKGVTLFEEKINDRELKRNYDISQFPSGVYQLKFQDDFKVHTVRMYANEGLEFDLDKSIVQFVPTIALRDKILSVGLATMPEEEIKIFIYDYNNHLLARRKITGSEYIGKRFDFSSVKPGTYRVVITCKGETFSKTFKI